MFVKTKQHDFYPISKIERLWSEGTGPNKIEFAEIEEVGTVKLEIGEFESITENRYPIIPANPNFFVLETNHEEDGTKTAIKSPILGWQYTSERGMLPVTIEGINHFKENTNAILTPEGRVLIAMDRDFDKVEDYVVYLNEHSDA
jgi:hypothetical protein